MHRLAWDRACKFLALSTQRPPTREKGAKKRERGRVNNRKQHLRAKLSPKKQACSERLIGYSAANWQKRVAPVLASAEASEPLFSVNFRSARTTMLRSDIRKIDAKRPSNRSGQHESNQNGAVASFMISDIARLTPGARSVGLSLRVLGTRQPVSRSASLL